MLNLEGLAGETGTRYNPSLFFDRAVGIPDKRQQTYALLKRLMDIAISAVAIIILCPAFLVIAAAIKLDSPGKVFYCHERIGRNGKKIRVLKFRSMVENADEIMKGFSTEQKKEFELNFKLDDDSRITRVGKRIRKMSLDELPQLLNILRGDMSFVGPRPIVEQELLKYGNKRDVLLSAVPGLTGFWQVNGRSMTTYEQRIHMELYYVNNASFGLDLKILLKTIPAVLVKRGAV